MTNSRQKGKRVELALVHKVRQHWHGDDSIVRAAQANGKLSADIIGVSGLHIECKGRRSFAIEKHMRQAERDTDGSTPVLLLQGDRCETLVAFRLSDTMAFCEAIAGVMKTPIYPRKDRT